MLNVFEQNTNNLRYTNSFLTSLLFGGELSDNGSKTSYNMEEINNQSDTKQEQAGDLELIYAKDGDANYDANLDSNGDSRISYKEYLRYCEQNSRMEEKRSDTKISEDRRKFTTYSYGHAANAYNRVLFDVPEGKVVSNI